MKAITNNTSVQPQGTATTGSKNPQRADTGKPLPIGSSAFTSVRLNAAGFTIAGMRAPTTQPHITGLL